MWRSRRQTTPGQYPSSTLSVEVERATIGSGFSPRAIRSTLWFVVVLVTAGLATLPFATDISATKRLMLGINICALLATMPIVFQRAKRKPDQAIAIVVAEGLAICAMSLFIDPTSAINVTPGMLLAVLLLTAIQGWRAGILAGCATTLALAIARPTVDLKYAWFDIAVFAIVLFGGITMIAFLTRYRQRLAADLARINTVVRSGVTDRSNLDETLTAVVEAIAHTMRVAHCSLALTRGDRLELVVPSTQPPSIVAVLSDSDSTQDVVHESPELSALHHKQLVLIESAEEFAHHYSIASVAIPGAALPDPVFPVAYIPLARGSEMIGVLRVEGPDTKSFSDSDLRVLQVYAQELGIIVLRAQAYEQAQATARKLAEADALKTEFLAMVSHELKTPVTAVKGFVDTILLHGDRIDAAKRTHLLERVSANTKQLTRLIEQLLDFARVDSDRIELRPLVCDLSDLTHRLGNDLAPILAGHEVAIEIDPTLRVFCDPDAFNHILTNLLSNATKFSPVDSVITIRARSEGTEVYVSVADQGMGIPENERELVFERFYQSHRNGTNRKGTGIGLAIVRRFVEHQGGRIWVDDSPGTGATFTFTLPRARRPVAPTVQPADPPPSPRLEAAADVRAQLLSNANQASGPSNSTVENANDPASERSS